MATMGPEERERFARRDEAGVPLSGVRREAEPPPRRAVKVVAGGSVTEALCGAGAVVLAIIGLTGLMAGYLASIATIVIGVALLAQGGSIAARFHDLWREAAPAEWDTRAELGSGMGSELLGGVAGVVLGILGLLGVATAVVVPIAIIVFGASLLLGSGAPADLAGLGGPAHERLAHLARQASMAAAGTQALAGVGAIVLGILALIGVDTVTLVLIALLVLGASVLLSGSAITGRMATLLHR